MFRYILYIFLFTGTLFFSVNTSFSQQYNFKNYSVDQGLAQSQVYSMCEDNFGNIWFATRGGGVSRFDGLHFTNYSTQEGLADNYINTISKDKSGNLWFGTDNGISKYNGSRFINYKSEQGLYNEKVNALLIDKQETIWIGTQDGIFQMNKDTIVRFGRKLGVPQEKINCLAQDTEGNVWAGTDFGLLKFSKNLSGNWEMNKMTTKEGLPVNTVNSIASDPADGIWVCTYGGGVARIKRDEKIIIAKNDGINSNTVFSCLVDGQTIWFGTAFGTNKLAKIDERDTLISITETEGLSNNVVMCILKDSFGNIWFGTSGGGVSKLDSERFKHFTAIKDVFGSWVYAIYQDKQGVMWFGTSEGGVTLYDGKIYKRFSDRNGFTASKVKCIIQDVKGNMWLGTIGDGLYKYDGNRFFHYTKQHGLNSKFVNYLLEDSIGNIWLGTAGGGISVLKSDNKIYPVRQFKNSRINVLIKDNNNSIWAGDEDGYLSRITFNESNDYTIQRFNTNSSSVRCGAMNKNGLLCFGTSDKGLLAYNGKDFKYYNKSEELFSNNIYSTIFDAYGNLWIGTDKGIDKIQLTEKGAIDAVSHFGKSEGFIGIEVIRNAACLDKDNQVWFGTVKGATIYNQQKEKKVPLPKLHLTGLNLFFDNIKHTPYGKNVSEWNPVPPQLELPYDKNHLSFEFAGIQQSNPEAVKYKWQLLGFDKNWSPVSSRTEAVYSNLPPGEYTFKVVASNENDIWTKPVVYSFKIKAPFWYTWWFNLLLLALVFFIVVITIYYFFQRVKIKNERERQKLETEKNLIELEQKALRLQMNPHFLFNCLNSIKGLIAEDKPEDAKLYLSRFAKLMRATLDNSREEFISLEQEIASLKNYVDLELLSREGQFGFDIQLSKDLVPPFILIPPMLVQPFLENSIIHGLAPKSEIGKLVVHFDKESDYIKCTIEDDGIGREKAEDMKEDSVHAHKSSAIAVTQERLNTINKKLNLKEIKIRFIDLKTGQGKPCGTKVELFIPYIEA